MDIISIRQYVVGLTATETARKQLILDKLKGKEGFTDLPGPAFPHQQGKPPNTVLGVCAVAVAHALFEIEVVAAISGSPEKEG